MRLYFYTIILITGISVTSCKTSSGNEAENKQRTDSLFALINTPELKTLNQKIIDAPNDAVLYHERSKIYLKNRQLIDAINDAKRAIRIDSTNADFYINEADVFFAANETKNCKDVLEKTVIKFPKNTEGLLKLGELYYFVKQYDNAFAKINDALKINENMAKAYFLKGDIYKEIGDTTKSVSSYETAIEQDNKHYDSFFNLGLIYASRKNPIAFEYYDNALSVNPTSIEVLYAKAKLLQDLKKIPEAIVIYEVILKQDALHISTLYNLGAIELEQHKDAEKALNYFSKAIEASPKYAEAYFASGVCYQELKDKNNAKADYQMCLQLKPNFQSAIEALNDIER